MMPGVKGTRRTKIEMLIYTLLLFPVAVAPFFLGYAGWAYGIGSTLLTGFFIFTAWRTLRDNTHASAKLMFAYSVFYLFALFSLLILEKLIL
jgi:protoheme IX farnesyltransferase